jgi:hypothetical protein
MTATIEHALDAVLRKSDEKKSRTLYGCIKRWLRESRDADESDYLAVARVRALMYAEYGNLEVVIPFNFSNQSDMECWSVRLRHWDGLEVTVTNLS